MRQVLTFMHNHHMLQLFKRPPWRVVKGGSSTYLGAFADRFSGTVHTGTRDVRVSRAGAATRVQTGGESHTFDAAVLACHSDQALRALVAPTAAERDVLGAIAYHDNQVFLHSDPRFMPAARRCWSSWNVVRDGHGRLTITYWMNRLQGLGAQNDYFVTLNPQCLPSHVHWQGRYQHPNFTAAAEAAKARWHEISRGGVYFAGAYWGAGFHEDGFQSGARCADAVLAEVARAA